MAEVFAGSPEDTKVAARAAQLAGPPEGKAALAATVLAGSPEGAVSAVGAAMLASSPEDIAVAGQPTRPGQGRSPEAGPMAGAVAGATGMREPDTRPQAIPRRTIDKGGRTTEGNV